MLYMVKEHGNFYIGNKSFIVPCKSIQQVKSHQILLDLNDTLFSMVHSMVDYFQSKKIKDFFFFTAVFERCYRFKFGLLRVLTFYVFNLFLLEMHHLAQTEPEGQRTLISIMHPLQPQTLVQYPPVQGSRSPDF